MSKYIAQVKILAKPDPIEFVIKKLDVDELRGVVKLAEKINENQGSSYPTILVKAIQ